jgi:prepilin-type processing-associated H-X9-DG protein
MMPGSGSVHEPAGRKDIKIGHGIVADRFKMVSKKYSPQNTFAMKHNKGDNFAFVDGHVKWMYTNRLAQAAPVEKFTWVISPDLSCRNLSFLPDFKSYEKPEKE